MKQYLINIKRVWICQTIIILMLLFTVGSPFAAETCKPLFITTCENQPEYLCATGMMAVGSSTYNCVVKGKNECVMSDTTCVYAKAKHKIKPKTPKVNRPNKPR